MMMMMMPGLLAFVCPVSARRRRSCAGSSLSRLIARVCRTTGRSLVLCPLAALLCRRQQLLVLLAASRVTGPGARAARGCVARKAV